ncbi:B12-binding domain-containing radical SAM protein [Nocardiopsis sp. EMB25]|uniref:B12-binding domain-containing radical SAM protein n=1 Tax=Nocardiopsis sp. EMB25 TaxID=2835867 RepID=UPI00228419A3|nr:radical SAM protein [Nocardiopsis sp. EMB25]MCY9787138.1 B12-binding domain-containing radical SAM protein [Nocardiopsis sp. EMB25]
MKTTDVLIITPFRRPDFRHAILPTHPAEEPIDSPALRVAAICENSGFETRLLALQNIFAGFDENTDTDVLRKLIGESSPTVVLFVSDNLIASRSTATVYGIDVVSKILRESSNTPIGFCGRLATTAAAEVLETIVELDFAIIGEPEAVVSDVLTSVTEDGVPALTQYPSVLTRECVQQGKRPKAAFVSDPNSLPIPAFHLAERSVELLLARRAFSDRLVPFSLRTSYGCKFRCKFCAGVPNWTNYRTRSAENFAHEVDRLYQVFPDTAYLSFLEDEIATRDVAHIRGIAKVLRDRSVRLNGLYTHSSLLTEEVVEQLAPVTDRVFLGLDNPSDEVLRKMGKGQRLSTVLTAAQRAREGGLRTHLEWIIGSPSETVHSLVTSLHAICVLLASNTVDSINTYVFCPHPGTEYRERAGDHGLVVHDPFHMLESGGYPASSTEALTRNQIFSAYLMSQVVISEIIAARQRSGAAQNLPAPSRAELERIFAEIGGVDG